MSNKNKLQRFADVAEFQNVLEPDLRQVIDRNEGGKILPHPIKGKWKSEFFT